MKRFILFVAVCALVIAQIASTGTWALLSSDQSFTGAIIGNDQRALEIGHATQGGWIIDNSAVLEY